MDPIYAQKPEPPNPFQTERNGNLITHKKSYSITEFLEKNSKNLKWTFSAFTALSIALVIVGTVAFFAAQGPLPNIIKELQNLSVLNYKGSIAILVAGCTFFAGSLVGFTLLFYRQFYPIEPASPRLYSSELTLEKNIKTPSDVALEKGISRLNGIEEMGKGHYFYYLEETADTLTLCYSDPLNGIFKGLEGPRIHIVENTVEGKAWIKAKIFELEKGPLQYNSLELGELLLKIIKTPNQMDSVETPKRFFFWEFQKRQRIYFTDPKDSKKTQFLDESEGSLRAKEDELKRLGYVHLHEKAESPKPIQEEMSTRFSRLTAQFSASNLHSLLNAQLNEEVKTKRKQPPVPPSEVKS